MKNIKSVISLALLAVAPTIYAQNIDTKAAPDVPTFSVTLNVTNNGGGLDSVFVKKTIETTKDSLILSGTNSLKLTYGATPSFRLKANSQYMLESFTVNGKKVTNTDMGEKFNDLYKDVNSYTYATPAGGLKEKTDIVIKWVAKPEVKLVITGTEQTVSDKAAAITVTADGSSVSPLSYYTDVACTAVADDDARKKAGTFYIPVKIAETVTKKGVDKVITMTVNNKKALTASGQSCQDVLIEGQTLASASITGGTVTSGSTAIKGTWAWMDPNTLVKAGASGSNAYKAIFTPDSAAFYNTVTADIGINVRKVATITVKQTAGGTVVIDSATVDNRYIAKNGSSYTTFKEMKVKATPNAGYKFKAWTSTPSISGGTGGEETAVTGTFTPTGDAVISATFEKATRTVKLATPDGGTVEVWNGTKQLSLTTEGTAVEVGNILTINAKPEVKNGKDQEVVKVGYTYTVPSSKANDVPETEATSFTVGGASGGSYEITATFQDKPANKFMVNVAPANNGAILLKNGENTVSPNASYDEGTSLNVIAVPNKGYRLKSLQADGKDIKETALVTVGHDDLNISAEFELEEYQVTVDDLGRVKFSGVSTQKYEYGKTLNISATVNDADKYRLAAILVNNKPVENNSDITIEGLVNISADVRTLSPLSILNQEETIVTYNGNAQPYVVETANKLAGFEFSYTNSKGETVDVPLNAETYTVKITRPADAVYQKFEAKRTLKIERAKPGILDIPAANQTEGLTNCTTVAGKWSFENGMRSARMTKAGGPTFVDATFTPKDDNLSKIETKVFETEKAKESATKATISARGTHGTVGFKNGNADISADLIYVGQTITLTLKADEGYYVDWNKKNDITGVSLDANHSFIVADGTQITIDASVAFVEKKGVTVTEKQEPIEKSYTSQMIDVRSDFSGLPSSVKTNGQFTYKQDGAIVEPINVGTYDVYAACAETDTHKALPATKVGTLKINPAKIEAGSANTTIVLPTASPVLKGTLLSVISLNGGYVEMNGMRVAGLFAWSEDQSVDKADGYTITFTPSDNNYTSNLIDQKVYVSLSDVQMYKMGVKIVNGGSVSITKSDGAEVKGGDQIPAGMQLTITSTSGIIENISGVEAIRHDDVNGKTISWTCIVPAADFTITVTFKSGSEGDGDTPGDEGVAVTGISLNKTTLTLPRLTSEKLVATVAPTGATKKDVKWTSTNPEVATVDADGTVKAVKYGQATIIATTVDGGFTAMCRVNVDFATAIEKILSESLVYSRNGQIIIEPAAPVEVSIINLGGQVIYNNSISSTVQVPANSGIYIVRMAAAGKATTTKVIVR